MKHPSKFTHLGCYISGTGFFLPQPGSLRLDDNSLVLNQNGKLYWKANRNEVAIGKLRVGAQNQQCVTLIKGTKRVTLIFADGQNDIRLSLWRKIVFAFASAFPKINFLQKISVLPTSDGESSYRALMVWKNSHPQRILQTKKP